jgi:hypothetical protein
MVMFRMEELGLVGDVRPRACGARDDGLSMQMFSICGQWISKVCCSDMSIDRINDGWPAPQRYFLWFVSHSFTVYVKVVWFTEHTSLWLLIHFKMSSTVRLSQFEHTVVIAKLAHLV